MKRCRRCGVEKALDQYHRAVKHHDGRQATCATCRNEQRMRQYRATPDQERAWRQASVERCQAFVLSYLRVNPCSGCGERDPVVLDFHHVGTKSDSISRLITMGAFKKLQGEIRQCVVLCANCHRRETARDFGWYRWVTDDGNLELFPFATRSIPKD